jgi:hypothetical protein
MVVPGQHRQKKKFVKPHVNEKKVGMVEYTYHPRDGGKPKIEGL